MALKWNTSRREDTEVIFVCNGVERSKADMLRFAERGDLTASDLKQWGCEAQDVVEATVEVMEAIFKHHDDKKKKEAEEKKIGAQYVPVLEMLLRMGGVENTKAAIAAFESGVTPEAVMRQYGKREFYVSIAGVRYDFVDPAAIDAIRKNSGFSNVAVCYKQGPELQKIELDGLNPLIRSFDSVEDRDEAVDVDEFEPENGFCRQKKASVKGKPEKRLEMLVFKASGTKASIAEASKAVKAGWLTKDAFVWTMSFDSKGSINPDTLERVVGDQIKKSANFEMKTKK